MRVKRDSLLLKIIFFNDIAIVITSLTIVSILTFFTFSVLDEKVPKDTKEEVVVLKNAYEMQAKLLKQQVAQVLDTQEKIAKITSMESSGENTFSQIMEKEAYYQLYDDCFDKFREPISKNPYDVLATVLSLNLCEVSGFNDETVAIIDEEGRVLGESLSTEVAEKFQLRNSEYFKTRNATGARSYDFSYNEYIPGGKNRLVLRIGVPIEEAIYPGFEGKSVVVSKVLGKDFFDFLNRISNYNEKNKVFLLAKQDYVYGQLDFPKYERFISKEMYFNFLMEKSEFHFESRKLGREEFYVGYVPLLGDYGQLNGVLGVAVSKNELIGIKSLAFILIIAGTFILILVSTTIFGSLFQNLVSPLIELAQISENISEGNYDVKLRIRGSGEIRTLLKSYKNMLEKIKKSDDELRDQNNKLQENINRITTIEKLLLAIHSENEFNKTIEIVLKAFTSDIGLNYGRAIFFRYDEEEEQLQADMVSVKKKMEKKGELHEALKELSFQREGIYKVLPLLKISMHDNLMAKSVLEKKIIYHNDRGYKYRLGSELLASLGINNFIILPIYTHNKSYGCILLDNHLVDRTIDHEEVELLNLLILNLGIYFENKNLEKEKIETQKEVTLGKLAQQILEDRKGYLDQFEELIEDAKQEKASLRDKVLSLEPGIKNLNKSNLILFDFSHRKEYNFQKLDLNSLIQDVLNELDEVLKRRKINISLFSKYRGLVSVDSVEIRKVLKIIIENAVEAIEEDYGKINIVLYRENEKVHIDIIDSGIGISENQLKYIFDPFVSYKKGNSGLGLPVAHKIIKEHGGKIKIRSKPGQGTEVKITLNAYKEE